MPRNRLRWSRATCAGASVLTAYASIEPLGWKVFVEQSFDEVFETLNAAILRSVALIAAGLLISALVALWLARSMVHPIRTLQEGAARIGAGDLDQKIDIKTGDELEALANQFNQMSAQLRESYAGLERKVEERTAELQETLEQQTATAEILERHQRLGRRTRNRYSTRSCRAAPALFAATRGVQLSCSTAMACCTLGAAPG